ncbi:MAG: dienelactone hydrolase [Halioglobus sp.]|nr:dienelactone hydrolase [Halioglobus sp.]
MTIVHTPISQFERSSFTATIAGKHEVTHDIYYRGNGPPVVLIQELPGIGKETLRLADKLVEAGFSVVLPHLFGPLEKTSMAGNLVRVMCMRKEFALFAANRSSPIVDWLRALCKDVRDSRNAKGVGVIGMCLTGNFAISLIGDDSVLAAVSSQPAMPFHRQDALHMSEDEVQQARHGLEQSGPMLGFRFEGDKLSTKAKFACIQAAFNDDGVERVRLCTLPGDGHSVFTLDFVDEQGHPTHEALEQVIEYFNERLI